jgi:hypothetical protein
MESFTLPKKILSMTRFGEDGYVSIVGRMGNKRKLNIVDSE